MNSEESIEAVCESCNTKMTFAADLKGSVQVCDKCGDFVDVGEVEWDEDDYAEDPEDIAGEQSSADESDSELS